MNLKIVHNFISDEEQSEIIAYANNVRPENKEIENEHIRTINNQINGFSILHDMTCTDLSKSVARFQGDSTQIESVPEIFYKIKERISEVIGINQEHVFFQCIHMKKGGRVAAHYDAATPGYVTYKCNVSVLSTIADIVHIDKTPVEVNEKDLYCFEASLYKHWVDKSEHDRILLSYGFLLPYSDLSWDSESPRVRMSNRIWKAFIKQ
jgi:hypothetical protein